MLVYLVVFDEKSFQLSGQIIGTVQSFIDANYVATRRETEYRGSRIRRRMEAEAFDASDLEEHEARYMKAQEQEEAPESKLLSGTICSNASLDDQFAHMGGTFQEKLFEMIEYRGLTNVEVYTRANLDRKHFSKIQCNVNYHPSKKTAMALCIALKLDLEESRDLLARAEWAFSPNRKLDLIVMNAIVNHEYNINQVNAILFEYGQECLGI
jgi:hypothetical protein